MVARLVASTSPSLTMPIYSGFLRSETNHGNIVEFPLTNLEPDTPYYYALEIDGRLDRKKAGEFRTFPAPGPASFTIAFASCAKTGSTSDVFDRIRENHPLFYMNMAFPTEHSNKRLRPISRRLRCGVGFAAKADFIDTCPSLVFGTITISAVITAIGKPRRTKQPG